jgi:hypothetical protein
MVGEQDIKELLWHLEEEYRNSKISEKSYQELKSTYTKQLNDLKNQDVTQTPAVDEKSEEQPNAEPVKEVPKEEQKDEQKEKKKLFGGLFGKKHKDEESLKPEIAKPDKEEKSNIDEDTGEVKMYGTGTAEDPYRSTPEVQQDTEEVEVKEEKPQVVGDTNTAMQIELEKLKAMIDNLREMKQGTDETIRQMSESIGEIRSMVFQADGNLKEMEMKVDQINDDISEVRPSEISKKFKEIGANTETSQITLEKHDKKFEDITTKLNETYDMLKGIGGLENLVSVNKNIQKKIEEMNEVSKYVERLSLKIEKVFVDMNKNLDDFVSYKIKQDGMFDSVNDLVKNVDGVNIKFEGYATKKDFQTIEEELLVVKKELEDITKNLPMINISIPEPVIQIRKQMDDIRMLIESLEEQHRNGKLNMNDYKKIKEVNQKKLMDLESGIKDEWNKIVASLRQGGTEEETTPVESTTATQEVPEEDVVVSSSPITEQQIEQPIEQPQDNAAEQIVPTETQQEPIKEFIEPAKKRRRTKKEMEEERIKEEAQQSQVQITEQPAQ